MAKVLGGDARSSCTRSMRSRTGAKPMPCSSGASTGAVALPCEGDASPDPASAPTSAAARVPAESASIESDLKSDSSASRRPGSSCGFASSMRWPSAAIDRRCVGLDMARMAWRDASADSLPSMSPASTARPGSVKASRGRPPRNGNRSAARSKSRGITMHALTAPRRTIVRPASRSAARCAEKTGSRSISLASAAAAGPCDSSTIATSSRRGLPTPPKTSPNRIATSTGKPSVKKRLARSRRSSARSLRATASAARRTPGPEPRGVRAPVIRAGSVP
jgi:hypothetical protein